MPPIENGVLEARVERGGTSCCKRGVFGHDREEQQGVGGGMPREFAVGLSHGAALLQCLLPRL